MYVDYISRACFFRSDNDDESGNFSGDLNDLDSSVSVRLGHAHYAEIPAVGICGGLRNLFNVSESNLPSVLNQMPYMFLISSDSVASPDSSCPQIPLHLSGAGNLCGGKNRI